MITVRERIKRITRIAFGYLSVGLLGFAAPAMIAGAIYLYAADEHALMVGDSPGRATRIHWQKVLDRLLPRWLVRRPLP